MVNGVCGRGVSGLVLSSGLPGFCMLTPSFLYGPIPTIEGRSSSTLYNPFNPSLFNLSLSWRGVMVLGRVSRNGCKPPSGVDFPIMDFTISFGPTLYASPKRPPFLNGFSLLKKFCFTFSAYLLTTFFVASMAFLFTSSAMVFIVLVALSNASRPALSMLSIRPLTMGARFSL